MSGPAENRSRRGEHQELGAYVLGGLSDAERSAFESHLLGCGQCRAELRSSRSLPRLLAAVPLADAHTLAEAPAPYVGDTGGSLAAEPPVSVLLGRLSTRRRRARRRRVGFAVVLAAACVALGALIAPVFTPAPEPGPTYALNSADGVRAQIGLERKAWGTELELTATSLPTRGTLSLWVVDHDGAEERAGSWSATETGKSAIVGAVPLQVGRIAEIEVRNDDGRVLALVALPEGQREL
ncbi:anti-sigma factor family protein [Arthrobacter sp. KK5.5]|uniref:anti-sigma factor family protein n=1 Tax=Arthrobacter sp. KK5.5 TaxID=3373084 RepID=UPI003EE6EDD0